MSAFAGLTSIAALSSPLAHLDQVLFLAIGLFAVGLAGVTCRRNVLIMLLSVEIMLNAANLAFVAFSRVHGNIDGQVVVFFAMVVAAAEVAVGLAIVIAVYRIRKETSVDELRDLAEAEYGPVPFPQLEGEDHHHDDDHHDEQADSAARSEVSDSGPDSGSGPGPEPDPDSDPDPDDANKVVATAQSEEA